jgi:hypothetical protein
LSQSAICCIAATKGPVVACLSFGPRPQRVYTDKLAAAPSGQKIGRSPDLRRSPAAEPARARSSLFPDETKRLKLDQPRIRRADRMAPVTEALVCHPLLRSGRIRRNTPQSDAKSLPQPSLAMSCTVPAVHAACDDDLRLTLGSSSVTRARRQWARVQRLANLPQTTVGTCGDA